ncbi:MAG: MlaD family protein [Rikenellaceae bacterium]
MKISREFKIGIFAVAMVICAWAGTNFLSGIDIFNGNRSYQVSYNNIEGVRSASEVMIRGVKVGTVTDIEFNPSISDMITLTLTIRKSLNIPVDSKATISGSGMMSSKNIELELGKSDKYLEDGGVITAGESSDLMGSLTSEFEAFKVKLDTLTSNLNRTLGNVNTLLEGSTENLNATVANLSGITSNVDRLLASEQQNIKRAVDGFADFSESLGRNAGQIDTLLVNLGAISTDINNAQIGKSLTTSLSELEKALKAVNEKSGSAGKIIYDEALYENLAASTKSLDALLSDLKQNPKRYVHFSVFSSNPDKQAERAKRDSIKMASKK